MLRLLICSLCVAFAAADTGTSSSDPCFADSTNTFHVTLDPYSSETGYYK